MRIKLILLLFFLSSCGSFSEAGKALRNEKTKTTDEFLIEKRGPLSLPPKMGELPRPNSNEETKKNKKNIFKKNIEDGESEKKSELEKILIEEIRNN